jgi:hypothetical protein
MGIKFDTFPYTVKILQINVIISIIIIFIQLYHKKILSIILKRLIYLQIKRLS